MQYFYARSLLTLSKDLDRIVVQTQLAIGIEGTREGEQTKFVATLLQQLERLNLS